MKDLLKSLFNRFMGHFGLRVYSLNAHGREDIQDIRKTGVGVESIFDVGANIGQSVVKFKSAFPDTHIYSFEPVGAVYAQLEKNTLSFGNLRLFKMALGSVPGSAQINIRKHQTTHTLAHVDDALATEMVNIDTVDRVCREHGVSRIGILKIDVEGFDMEVLKGSEEMLSSRAIDFVLVECGFTPDDARHVLFDEVRDFLSPYGFRLFGIYDQQLEWSGERRLRFANACFALQ